MLKCLSLREGKTKEDEWKEKYSEAQVGRREVSDDFHFSYVFVSFSYSVVVLRSNFCFYFYQPTLFGEPQKHQTIQTPCLFLGLKFFFLLRKFIDPKYEKKYCLFYLVFKALICYFDKLYPFYHCIILLCCTLIVLKLHLS